MIYRFLYPLSVVEMYKRMGVEIGEDCKFQFEVNIDYSHYWLISIGNRVTLAPRVHILAHDASTKNHLGYTKIAKVKIEDNVFVGAGTIILPGVTIGKNSIIGSGSVVSKSIPENSVAVGNPAKVISELDIYLSRQKELMKINPIYKSDYTLFNITNEKKIQMIKDLENRIGFIE
jgi:maltose O-acetyltransferase